MITITKDNYESELKELREFIKSNPDALRCYVYAMIDPRDNKVFYIGKGQRTRVMDHVFEALKLPKDPNAPINVHNKLDLIRAIHNSGNKVNMYILHWGMTDEHALIVESVLIDVFQNLDRINTQEMNDLTNAMKGFDARRGFTSIGELKNALLKEPAKPLQGEKVLVIRINETSNDDVKIYQRVRRAWKLNPEKANEATYIAACRNGVIVGLYVNVSGWQPVKEDIESRRYEFEGHPVTNMSVRERYINKVVDFKKGASNPISYYFGW